MVDPVTVNGAPVNGAPLDVVVDPPEPPSWADLYARTRELTLRAQTGAAESVLSEVNAVLAQARAAEAERIVHQLLFVEALCNYHLGHLDECVAVCDELTGTLSDDPVDRGWLSSCSSMRALARIVSGERSAGMAELTEAALHLRDAPPRGLAFIWAANVLGVGYLAVRMYELALLQYDQIGADTSVKQFPVSAFYRVRNAQLAHICWGLELDRTADSGAAEHFRQAMVLGAQALLLVPSADAKRWTMSLAARDGLCNAFLGRSEEAIEQLAPVVEPLSRHEVEDALVARIGLVRAYASSNREVALAHADRALVSITHTTEYALAVAAQWERVRRYADEPDAASATAYALLLARTSWRDRSRMVSTIGTRLATEIARRQQMRETESMLFDAATGLASRFAFVQRMSTAVAEAQQRGGVLSIAFMNVRADAFEETLHKLIATLKVDVLARYDTYELATLAVGFDGAELADRLRACGADVLTHVVAGVATLREPWTVSGLVMHADEALRAAHGRGGVCISEHAG